MFIDPAINCLYIRFNCPFSQLQTAELEKGDKSIKGDKETLAPLVKNKWMIS